MMQLHYPVLELSRNHVRKFVFVLPGFFSVCECVRNTLLLLVFSSCLLSSICPSNLCLFCHAWKLSLQRVAHYNDTSYKKDVCSVTAFLDPSSILPDAAQGKPPPPLCLGPTQDNKLHQLYDLTCTKCPYFLQSSVVSAQPALEENGPWVQRSEEYDLRPTLDGCQFDDELALLAREVFPELGEKLGISVAVLAPLHLASEVELLNVHNRMFYKPSTFGGAQVAGNLEANKVIAEWSDDMLRRQLLERRTRLGFCETSFLAVWALVAQWYLVRVSPGYLAQEYIFLDGGHLFTEDEAFSVLQPWPLSHRAIPLRMNFYPFTRGGCCDPAVCSSNKLVLRVQTHPRCGMQFSDRTLTTLCRARFDEEEMTSSPVVEAATPSRSTSSRKSRRLPLPECPPAPTSVVDIAAQLAERMQQRGEAVEDEKREKAKAHLENKYEYRVLRNQCSYESGLWAEPMADRFKCMTTTIGVRLNMRPGERVLDYGTGCGHMLTWFSKFFGVRGLGVDILHPAITWAKQWSVGRYCHVAEDHDAEQDSQQLEKTAENDGHNSTKTMFSTPPLFSYFPPESFEYIVSCGALIHAKDACGQLRRLLRSLTVGGKAWFGCMPMLTDEEKRKNLYSGAGEKILKTSEALLEVASEDGSTTTITTSSSIRDNLTGLLTDDEKDSPAAGPGDVEKPSPKRVTYAASQLTQKEWIQCVTDNSWSPNHVYTAFAVQDYILFDGDSEMYALEHAQSKEPEWFSMTGEHFSLLIEKKS
ncbi:unnamed protein product [Amoebophrya sp. A25]|nr:unnamed protein product [Amoebophrya sp. A25]|eukprot:GSA25T00007956001.1